MPPEHGENYGDNPRTERRQRDAALHRARGRADVRRRRDDDRRHPLFGAQDGREYRQLADRAHRQFDQRPADPLAFRAAQRRLVGRDGDQEPRHHLRSRLARPRGRRVHDRELPPRPDHDPRRAGPPGLRLRRRKPHRGGAAPHRPRRGPRLWSPRSAAAAASRRESPTPPSPATPSKATSATAATAEAPPRSSRSAIMASSPR